MSLDVTVRLPRFPLKLIAAFFALYVIWGSTYLAILIGIETWPPLMLGGVRFLIAGTLMFTWMRLRGAPMPTWREWRAGGAIGVLLLSCGNGGVTMAEYSGVSSGVAALAVATTPLFTLLFSQLWGHRNTALEWAGIALGLCGMVFLNLGSTMQASPAGAAMILFSAIAWAFGSMWSRRLPLPAGGMASAVEMLVGGATLLLAGVIRGERMTELPSAGGWAALAFLVVFGSLIAFSSYQYLLRTVRPAAATSYAYVNPMVAVLLGVLFAGEHLGAAEVVAMLIIISAVVLIGLPQWRRRAAVS